MPNYVIFDVSSGTGKRFFMGSEAQAALQAGQGEDIAILPDAIVPGIIRPRYLTVSGGVVVYDGVPLADAAREKVAVLSGACRAAIESGFQSSALGQVGSYGSSPIDQLNILHAMSSADGGNLRVGPADGSGTWPLVAHTQAQAQQVHSDFLAACTAARQKLATLSAQVNAATTADAIAAVTW